MKRPALLALVAVTMFGGCAGSGSAPPATTSARESTSAYQTTPYQVQVVTGDPALPSPSPSPAPSGDQRGVQESFGGVPSKALLTDATNFPPGSQANFAIESVSAIANGVAYPIVQYPVPVVINVLNYEDDALLLGAGVIPAIQYSGVDYVIDPAKSSVVISGHSYPMSFQTGADTTITNGLASLYFPDPVNAQTTAPNFLVDFNAATWITIVNGTANVVPQGAGTVLSEAAVIQGTILNKAGGPVSGAIVSAYGPDGVISNSAPSASNGTFSIQALSGNGYSLLVWNTYAPVDSIITATATGNDPLGWTVNGPTVTVPAGYSVNVGIIRD